MKGLLEDSKETVGRKLLGGAEGEAGGSAYLVRKGALKGSVICPFKDMFS